MSALFLYSGALFRKSIPAAYSSSEELLGQVLLLILIPAFLVTYLIVAQRRLVRFADKLVASNPVSSDPADTLQKIAGRTVLLGLILGFLYGLLINVPAEWRNSFGTLGFQVQSILIGQVFLWTLIGLVLSYRLHTALSFYN